MYEVKGHWRKAALAATVVLVASGVTGALPSALPHQFAPAAAAQKASAIPADSYLNNTWTSDPPTVEGNLSDESTCVAKWQTQAVYSAQLGRMTGQSSSTRGFLQDVMYGEYPTGKLQLQHFPSGKNVAWRLPIAVDQQIKGATLVIDFNDPDYDQNWANTMTAAKVSQNPGWWDAPGANPQFPEGRTWFQRFTGLTGYVPLADEPLPVRVDAAARKIYVDLGDMPAKSSTVLSFSAVPANGADPQAANNMLSYGLRATLDGSSITSCYNPSYAPQNVVVGTSGNQLPAPTDPTRPLPNGTTYAIAPGYQPPTGWNVVVDPNTGVLTVTPGPNAVPGDAINVPVVITYSDRTTDTAIAPIVVADNESGLNNPGYQAGNVKPGESLTLQQTVDTDLPPGTRFSVPSEFTPPAGWTYSIDPNTGAVSVTAPAGAQPGDRIDVPVTVTYPDGSTDSAMASVVVIPNDSQANSPAYDQATTKPGTEVTIPQVGDTQMPDGTQYTLDGYTPPTGWTVTIDPGTGALTVTPPVDANPGDTIAVPVVIKYPDGSTETVTAPVVVTANDAQLNSPGYSPGEAMPGQQITLPQDRDTDMPAGTTYAIRDNFTIPDGWTVSVDASTGAVTATPPADANPGDVLSVPVVATYPDKSSDTALAAVTVIANQAQLNAPGYEATTTKPGASLTLNQTRDETLPDGTEFTIDPSWTAPDGWTVTIDANTGAVSYTVPANAQPGDAASVPVVVTYPDDSVDRTFATVSVIASDAMNHAPGYDPATTTPGTQVVVEQTRDTAMPAEATYAIQEGWNPPSGWTVAVDPATGAATVTPPADAQPGQAISVPVVVTYSDGSVDNTFVGVTVTPNDTQAHSPGYLPGSTTAGVPVTIEQTLDPNLPVGTTYTVDPASIPAGWTATVGADGSVTVTPPASANPGDSATFTVTVRYPDGTTDTAPVTVVVNANASQQTDLHYDSAVTKPGVQVDVDPQIAPSTPAGTVFTADLSGVPAGWIVSIDAGTGVVSATPPADAQPNDKISVPVTATYTDGSVDTTNATIVVIPSDAQNTTVTYDPASTTPTNPVDIIPTITGTHPEGGTAAIDLAWNRPSDWDLSVDPATGVVTATPHAGVPAGTVLVIPVVYTYADGSSETAYAPVTVEASQADNHAPGYNLAHTNPGEAVTVNQELDTTMPDGTTYGPGTGGQIPPGWNVSIDPNNGAVTATPPADAAAGDTALIPVTITYPDGSVDTATATIVVKAPPAVAYSPGYPAATVAPGGTVTVDQTQDTTVPTSTTYAIDTSSIPAGWTVSIDPNSGQITAEAPADALAGQVISVPVTLTYSNGTTQTVYAAITVHSVDERKYNPYYDSASTRPGEQVSVPLSGDPVPANTSFTQGPTYVPPTGWTISVDPNTGAVSVTPPDSARVGDSVSVPVIVAYPDGSQEIVHAVVTVENTEARTYDPSYPQTNVQLGVPATVSQDGDQLPDGTTYAIESGWTRPAGWTVTIDPETGAVTATATDDALAGTSISVPVVITYPDGTTDQTAATFTLLTTDARAHNPGYDPATTQPGTPVPVPQTGDITLPDGTRYTIPDTYTPPTGWTATVDPATGVVTVTPPSDAKNGDSITVPVVVSYPDESMDDSQVAVTVTVLDNVTYSPNYNLVSTKPGTTVSSPQLATGLPDGTTFEITNGYQVPAGWTITIDETTGEVTFVVPPNAVPTAVVSVPVTVRYPDGSTGTTNAQVKVEQSAPGDTVIDRGTIEPGQTIVLDPQDPNLYPPGTVFRFPDGWTPPPGWEVSFDQDKVQLTITAPPTAQPGDVIAIPMFITTPDGREFNRTVIVTVVEPTTGDTDAERYKPTYPMATTKAGQQVTVQQNGDSLPAGTTCEFAYIPEGWDVDLGPNCEVIATPPAGTPVGTWAVQVKFIYPDGSRNQTFADITVDDDTPVENPDWADGSTTPDKPVELPNKGGDVPEGSTTEVEGPGTAEIKPDGTLVVTPGKDAKPGDKITVVVKDKDGNELDTVTVTVTEPDAPVKNPDWNDGSTTPDKPVELPNKGGDVPDGSTVEVTGPGTAEIKPDGTLVVTPGKDAKPGDKITVVVKDKDGNELDTVTVTIKDPDAPAENPDWNDGSTTPDKPVELPNKGGDVPEGSTTEVEGPGTAEIKPDGTLVVTPGKDAKPGDKITVVVKDKDGNELDTVTVTIKEQGGGSLGDLDLGSIGGGDGSSGSTEGTGSLGSLTGSLGGGDGSGSTGGTGSLGSLTGSLGGGNAGSSAGSLALGSLALGGLAIGGLIWAINNHMIMLPPGFVLPPFLAPFFPGLVEQPPLPPVPPAPPAPGPDVDNGRG